MGSQSHIHLRRAKKVCDGASKQARWTSIVPIAQNRSSVRLHCHIVLKHPLLLLTAARRPLFVISLRRLVAGASCARKFRADIRTSYRPPEGLSARRSAGPRGGCGVLCLLHVACVLYDLHPHDLSNSPAGCDTLQCALQCTLQCTLPYCARLSTSSISIVVRDLAG